MACCRFSKKWKKYIQNRESADSSSHADNKQLKLRGCDTHDRGKNSSFVFRILGNSKKSISCNRNEEESVLTGVFFRAIAVKSSLSFEVA